MPEHTSFLSYLLRLFPALGENASMFGKMVLSGKPVAESHVEASLMAILIALFVLVLAFITKGKLASVEEAVIPEDSLSLRTFVELFIGYFYGLARDVMGPKRAKQFFPVIGTCALFIFFSNVLGLIPGMEPPTSNLNVTAGCAVLVFLLFNYYGIRENGSAYFKHLFGPWLGPAYIPVNILLFFIETISLCIRPVTLAIRLMVNMAVDHLVGATFIGLIALFVPIPVMILGIIVIVVQTLVFCLLTSVYIGLATEHEEHH